MSNFRRVTLSVAVLLALLTASVAFAQESTLTPEDEALFSTANGNSIAAASMDYSFSLNLLIEDGEGAPIEATLSGEGVFGNEFLMVLTGEITDVGPIDLEVRGVGDIGYVLGLAGEGEWLSFSQEDLTTLGGAFGDQLPGDPAALMEGDLSSLGLSDDAQIALFTALGNFDPTQYISVEAVPVEGETEFSADIDLIGLSQDPAIAEVVAIALQSQDASLSAEDAAVQAQQGVGLAQAILAGGNVTAYQYIDATTELVTGAALDINLGSIELGGSVSLQFEVALNEYDVDTSFVTAPESSTPVAEFAG
ncbi:MAG: hypothetical protein ACOYL5_01580 [Phototrophicaceae bacterium]|jgi:hypothetical protein